MHAAASTAWPAWAVMWALAFAVYAACKAVTWIAARDARAPIWLHAAYLLAWPGMDAPTFLREPRRDRVAAPGASEWIGAVAKLALGVVLLFGAAPRLLPQRPLVGGWLAMLGLVLALHFGLFQLISCFFRTLGIQATALMDAPLFSTSLREFWGRRWNRAFRDLTHWFLYRPLASRLGASAGLIASFAASGLVHDLVISLPARGGYGGPTVFFLLQGLAIAFERSRVGRRLGLGVGARGRLFTLALLAAPVGLLFHPPFVRAVIVPFVLALAGNS